MEILEFVMSFLITWASVWQQFNIEQSMMSPTISPIATPTTVLVIERPNGVGLEEKIKPPPPRNEPP